MGESPPPLHFLFVSFPGQGHLNPLLRLAKRVASRGPLVTLSTTVDLGRRLSAAAESDPIPVGPGLLRFEFFDDGADPTDPRRDDLDPLMARLASNGPPALTRLIHRQAQAGRPVSCLVNNPFLPWALDVAQDLGIPTAVLWVQSCAVFSTYYHFYHKLADFPTAENPDRTVNLPGLPPMRPDDLPTFLLPSNPYKSLTNVLLAQFENISKARWVFANSFEELEREVFKAMERRVQVIPVGPLVEAGEPQEEIKADMWKAADNCIGWLDRQEKGSVVYVSVGSVVVLSSDEMHQLAFGLRDSGRPFLWVVRENLREFLPEGFEEEIEREGKSLLVEWSPQEKVLAHDALACFVTHCGWNSTLELIAAGVPAVAFPQWGDQIPDAKFLCDVHGIGVRLPAPAARADIARCLAAATDGPEAEAMLKRAKKWKELAVAAVAAGGSSDRNIDRFVDDVRKWVTSGGGGVVDPVAGVRRVIQASEALSDCAPPTSSTSKYCSNEVANQERVTTKRRQIFGVQQGGRILIERRSRLKPDILDALIYLKD